MIDVYWAQSLMTGVAPGVAMAVPQIHTNLPSFKDRGG